MLRFVRGWSWGFHSFHFYPPPLLSEKVYIFFWSTYFLMQVSDFMSSSNLLSISFLSGPLFQLTVSMLAFIQMQGPCVEESSLGFSMIVAICSSLMASMFSVPLWDFQIAFYFFFPQFHHMFITQSSLNFLHLISILMTNLKMYSLKVLPSDFFFSRFMSVVHLYPPWCTSLMWNTFNATIFLNFFLKS